MIYYATASATISWDEDSRAVITQMRHVAASADYRAGIEKGLELLIAKGGCNWIGDTRYHSPLNPEDQEWIAKEWQPRALAAGLKRLAIVIAEDGSAREVVHRVASQASDMGIDTAYFHHLDEAKAWLRSLNPPARTRVATL